MLACARAQWPGNVGDLDFRPVVRDAAAFLLCARHVDEVAKMSKGDAVTGKVPALAFRVCAFFRMCVAPSRSAALWGLLYAARAL